MNDQIQAAQERLRVALLEGKDPAPHRQAIERMEADFARRSAEQAQAAAEAAEDRADNIARRAEDIADEATDRLLQARDALPALPVVDVGSSQIRYLAEALAKAEAGLRDAKARHAEMASRVGIIQGRIVSAFSRKDELRAKLKAGELPDKVVGALLAAVDEDLTDLRAMRFEAERAEQDAKPAREELAYSQAVASLSRVERLAEVEIVRKHVSECDAALMESLRQSSRVLHAAGLPAVLQSIWQPSNDLTRAVHYRMLPPSGFYRG